MGNRPKNILIELQDGVFRSIKLLFAPTFASIRTGCASDREWPFLTDSNMAVTGIQCASVYWMSNSYLANPWSFGRGYGRCVCVGAEAILTQVTDFSRPMCSL